VFLLPLINYDNIRSTPLVTLAARILLVINLLIIYVASNYGRELSRNYHFLIKFVPYSALAATVIGIGFITYRVRTCIKDGTLHWIVLKDLLLLTVGALMAGIGACEFMIVVTIERVHFVKYSALAFFTFFSISNPSFNRRIVIAVLFACTLGFIEEGSQYWMPDRTFDTRDLMLDACSSMFGGLYAWIGLQWATALRGNNPRDHDN